tara:strand:- start:17 stop:586 length:570 start_codon:yes stop_codon:yes gene_type:complete
MSTLKVDTILKRTGTGTITVGQSGDTIDLSNPTSITLNSTMKNTPSFQAKMSSDQTISSNTATKIQFNSELFDSDSAYDNSSNYRFTPQTAGKYIVYAQVFGNSGSDANYEFGNIYIYKNGSHLISNHCDFRTNNAKGISLNITNAVDFNGSSDYVEIFALVKDSSGSPVIDASSGTSSAFGAYRILGA